MATVFEVIRGLWNPPRPPGILLQKDKLDRMIPENFAYYKSWGFNIYRTHYSEESDKYWATLLDALKRQTYLALRYVEEDTEYELDARVRIRKLRIYHHPKKEDYMEDLKRLRKLFHLEVREGPELEGLDIYQVRKICAEENKQGKVVTVGGCVQYVLVADESVLRDIAKGEFVVKAVAYKWDSCMNWGWMRIPTGSLLELWQSLVTSDGMDRDTIRFRGPEEVLEKCIWPGDDSMPSTSCCSEVRPLYHHYSGQDLWDESEQLQRARAARICEQLRMKESYTIKNY